jgi:dipeptidyl aminopeptidase/acylaminoacyl peptidase
MNRIGILLSIVVIGVTGCTQTQKIPQQQPSTTPQQENKMQALPQAKPTPMLFEEMTVPYLRQRSYESNLAQLQKISEAPNYTTYLTSYNSDGLKINALLTQPTGEKPPGGWPAIVFVHGYIPPTQYRTTEKYVEYVNYLARNGFVVLKIDLRGHGSSEGEPGGGYYSSDYVIDTLNARTALKNADFVNRDRVGLWGHSMAGNVILRSSVAAQNIPAVVIWAGAGYTYTDLRTYRISDTSYRPQPSDSEQQRKRRELFNVHGDFSQDSEFWKQVVPTNYLSDTAGAIQLNHAVDDTVVNVEYSRNLNKILNTTPLPHELHEYPSGEHNISGPSFLLAMQNTVAFYKKHL